MRVWWCGRQVSVALESVEVISEEHRTSANVSDVVTQQANRFVSRLCRCLCRYLCRYLHLRLSLYRRRCLCPASLPAFTSASASAFAFHHLFLALSSPVPLWFSPSRPLSLLTLALAHNANLLARLLAHRYSRHSEFCRHLAGFTLMLSIPLRATPQFEQVDCSVFFCVFAVCLFVCMFVCLFLVRATLVNHSAIVFNRTREWFLGYRDACFVEAGRGL
jgi:hypothetical protein